MSEERIKNSTYPGRGIVIGKTPDLDNLVQIYWIMGRSENSRNRIFEEDGDFVRTKAFDESKLTDPSLIIYYPVKSYNEHHIVTNGDQTDTILSFLKKGDTFESALNTRSFEPDPPNYTPRISGIIDVENQRFKLSILKTIDNNADLSLRTFYNYDSFINGYGHCITTYMDDGEPLPSFTGEPYMVNLKDDIDENAERFWNYLNKDNRVSLLVKYINIRSREVKIKIINKNTSEV